MTGAQTSNTTGATGKSKPHWELPTLVCIFTCCKSSESIYGVNAAELNKPIVCRSLVERDRDSNGEDERGE